MNDLESFYQKYPNQTIQVSSGKTFTYRYYKNPDKKATIVLLTGGIALLYYEKMQFLHFLVTEINTLH